ncbi:MAG: hypothetical protein AABZ06_06105 [Bdellovibrionota bacterium]
MHYRTTWFVVLLSFLIAIHQTAYIFASEDDDTTGVISEIIPIQELKKAQAIGSSISETLFSSMGSIKLLRLGDDNFSVALYVQRKIYDNENIPLTYSIVDKIRVRLDEVFPLSDPDPSYGFFFGFNQGLELIRIRQKTRQELTTIPSLHETQTQIEQSDWYRGIKSGLPINTPPLIPLKASDMSKFDNQETLSFIASGGVYLGAAAVFSLDPTLLLGLVRAGISVSAFIRGEFQVSVIKESNNISKIKVSRLRAAGIEAGAGVGNRLNFMSGAFYLRKISGALKIIPFQMNMGFSDYGRIETTYRYDLSNPHGREAFEQAMLGQLAISEQYAVDSELRPRNFALTGVEKISLAESDGQLKYDRRMMKLSFIFKTEDKHSLGHVETTITTADGIRRTFEAAAENSTSWRLLFNYEKFYQNFAVKVDLNQYEKNPDDESAVTLRVSGSIKDSNTTTSELMRYILDIEDTINSFAIFPRPPDNELLMASSATAPSVVIPLPVGSVGTARLHYTFELSQSQLKKLISADGHERWMILERVFGVAPGEWQTASSRHWFHFTKAPFILLNVPLYMLGTNMRQGSILIHAQNIESEWQQAGTKSETRPGAKQDVRSFAKATAKIFSKSLYNMELIRLIRHRLDGEHVQAYVDGYGTAYAPLSVGRTAVISSVDQATEMQRQLDLSRKGSDTEPPKDAYQPGNPHVRIIDGGKIAIGFTMPSSPSAMFFRVTLDKRNWWWPFGSRHKSDVLLYNTTEGPINAGDNTLIIDTKNMDDPLYPLVEPLKKGKTYILQLSANPDGAGWGKSSQVQFIYP